MIFKAIFGVAGILFYSCYFSFSQNLVPNYSFENYSNCPIFPSSPVSFPTPWFSANISSPDFYHSCAGYVPNNPVGYQSARMGLGYFGVFAYEEANPDTREYIEIPLIDTLRASRKYCVEFYISLSDVVKYAIDGMGAFLSPDTIYDTTYYFLPYQPQIKNPAGTIISDTSKWTLISGSYIAQGGEKYITIGNFLKDSETTVSTFNLSGAILSYYLIDDVSVIPCDCDTTPPIAQFSFNFFNNITVYFANQSSTYANYFQWDFGDNHGDIAENPVHTYDSSGTYTVTLVSWYNGCSDTMVAQINVVGIDEVKNEKVQMQVYPNPSNGKVNISLQNFVEGIYSIAVFDITGRKIKQYSFTQNELEISGEIEKGIYLLSLFENNLLVYTEKLIKLE